MATFIRLLTAIYENQCTLYGEGLTIPFLVGCCTADGVDSETRIRQLALEIVAEPLRDGFVLRLQSCGPKDVLALKRRQDPPHEQMIPVENSNTYCRVGCFQAPTTTLSHEQFIRYLVTTCTPHVRDKGFSFNDGKWGGFSKDDLAFINEHGSPSQ